MGRPKRNQSSAPAGAVAPPPVDDAPDVEQLDGDEDCRIDGGFDGAFTMTRRRRSPEDRSDRDSDDLPDEAPPGWCES